MLQSAIEQLKRKDEIKKKKKKKKMNYKKK